MPAPLPFSLRQRLYKLWKKEHTPATLAQRLQLPLRTVSRLCQAFAEHGEAALQPAYRSATDRTPTPAIQQALVLHALHETWGAPYLRLRLRKLHPELTEIPSARTLQRWFRRFAQPPAPAGRKPDRDRDRAQRVHQVRQMDAVEQLLLANGQLVCWLRSVDEFSGAVLRSRVFPLRQLCLGAAPRCVSGTAERMGTLGDARTLSPR